MWDQATAPAKRFVWWSTDKSVAEGIPSVLAAVEVVVAVAAYWAPIAIYFETTTHLSVSIAWRRFCCRGPAPRRPLHLKTPGFWRLLPQPHDLDFKRTKIGEAQ
jgi:hypothetical protein